MCVSVHGCTPVSQAVMSHCSLIEMIIVRGLVI